MSSSPATSNRRVQPWRVHARGSTFLRLIAATLAAAALAVTGTAQAEVPVSHVVVIMQENHSFDNVLGQLCIQDGRECNAAASGVLKNGTVVPLTPATDVVPQVGHTQKQQLMAMNGGLMNGFNTVPGCKALECYVQYDPTQIPSLATLARQGAISDSFFSRDIVPSWAAHLDFFAQTLDGFTGATNPSHLATAPKAKYGWGCDSNLDAEWEVPLTGVIQEEPSCVPTPLGTGPYRPSPVQYVPTVADRIEEAGKTWGIYGATNTKLGPDRFAYRWAICPTFAECLNGPQAADMHEEGQFFTDAAAGALPNLSILTPFGAGNSEANTSQHNGFSMLLGDNEVGHLVEAIQAGPDGPSTTIFIYYDDCGCFYDHVTPPPGLGIRLPLVIVSPYARAGFTDHNVATNSSILAYAEHVIGFAPLNSQDETAYDFSESFNYAQAPAPPFHQARAAVPKASLEAHAPPDASGT